MKVIVAVVVLFFFAIELATPVSAANTWTTYTSSLTAAKEVGNEPSNETATAQVRDYPPTAFFFLCLIFYLSHLTFPRNDLMANPSLSIVQGTLVLEPDGVTVSFAKVSITSGPFNSGNITLVHIHAGSASVNGPPIYLMYSGNQPYTQVFPVALNNFVLNSTFVSVQILSLLICIV